MAKYTTEVRSICESVCNLKYSMGYNDVNKIIKESTPKIFDFDFPMFDESYRPTLCNKILKHYYTREIGFETVGLWKLKLDMTLNEIMPFYNQLYESELIKFNPLYDVDVSRDYTKTDDTEKIDNLNSTGSEVVEYKGKDVEVGVSKDKGSNKSEKVYNDNETKENSITKNETIDKENERISDDVTNEDSQVKDISNSVLDVTSNNDVKTSAESEGWVLYSDTPQGSISKIGMEGNNYLTTATKNTGEDTSSVLEKGSSKTQEDKTSDITGNKNILVKGEVKETDNITSVGSVKEVSGSKNNGNEEVNSTLDNVSSLDNTVDKTYKNDILRVNEQINKGNVENLETYFERVVGKQSGVSNSKLLMEFRETFLNIDKMIIDELSDLFMLVW